MNRFQSRMPNRAQTRQAHRASVSSLRERREREQYAGFEGKVMMFDETVALGPAQLVELVDIENGGQEPGHD